MEITRMEVAALEEAIRDVAEDQVVELDALQLTLVGGGIGIVIVA